MLFTCKHRYSGLTVILEPGRTVFQGPHDKQMVSGTQAKFVKGFFEIDATIRENLEFVKRLVQTKNYGTDFYYVSEPIKVMVGGRMATMEGYSLEEALLNAEAICKAREEGSPIPEPLAPSSDVINTDIPGFDVPINTSGVSITTGVVNSHSMKPSVPGPPKAGRKTPPSSKFVKPVSVAPAPAE